MNVFALNSQWFLEIFCFVVISSSQKYDFRFTKFTQKASAKNSLYRFDAIVLLFFYVLVKKIRLVFTAYLSRGINLFIIQKYRMGHLSVDKPFSPVG